MTIPMVAVENPSMAARRPSRVPCSPLPSMISAMPRSSAQQLLTAAIMDVLKPPRNEPGGDSGRTIARLIPQMQAAIYLKIDPISCVSRR